MTKPITFEEPRFVILRKVHGIPAMAGCTVCGQKFFTPSRVGLNDDMKPSGTYASGLAFICANATY